MSFYFDVGLRFAFLGQQVACRRLGNRPRSDIGRIGRPLAKCFSCVFVFVLVLVVSRRSAFAQPATVEPSAAVRVTSEIEAITGDNFRAKVDLGSLPAGASVPIALTLVNATQMTFQIDTISKTCGCLEVKAPPNAGIAPGEQIEIELRLDMPSTSTEADGAQVITLFDTQKLAITVPLEYRIAGLVSFYGAGFNTKMPADVKRHDFRIPFFFTSPADPRNLSVETSESLSALSTQIVREGDKWFVKCQLNSNASVSATITGNVTLSDRLLGVSATTRCILEVKQPVVVSPSVLRFSPREKERNTQASSATEYTATAVCVVDKTLLSVDGEIGTSSPSQEVTPSFQFTTPSRTFDVKKKRLSNGIYRLYVSIQFDKGEDDALEALRKEGLAELFYSVKVGRKVVRGKVRAVFK